MFSIFQSTDLGNGYALVQPPAGLLPEVHKRLKMFSDMEGKLTSNYYAAVFILACLHKDGIPVFGLLASTVPACTMGAAEASLVNEITKTIRAAYTVLPDMEFKAVVDEFLFNIDRDLLEKWFDAVDESCYITKKTVDVVKND